MKSLGSMVDDEVAVPAVVVVVLLLLPWVVGVEDSEVEEVRSEGI